MAKVSNHANFKVTSHAYDLGNFLQAFMYTSSKLYNVIYSRYCIIYIERTGA